MKGLPPWLSGKESACQCRFKPWVRKIPWRRKWQPTPVFLRGKSHRRRSLAGTAHGVARAGQDLATKIHNFRRWTKITIYIKPWRFQECLNIMLFWDMKSAEGFLHFQVYNGSTFQEQSGLVHCLKAKLWQPSEPLSFLLYHVFLAWVGVLLGELCSNVTAETIQVSFYVQTKNQKLENIQKGTKKNGEVYLYHCF